MCPDDVPRVPSLIKRLTVHQEGFGVGLLEVDDGEDHGLYLGLYVVGLVDHVVDARAPLGLHQLDVDQEELERVDGADYEVVVGVLAVVEVEAPKPPLVEEQRDYVLYVRALQVMPEVYKDLGPLAEPGFNVWSIVVANLGAIILLILYRLVAGRMT